MSEIWTAAHVHASAGAYLYAYFKLLVIIFCFYFQVDIWSMGILMIELIDTSPPFMEDDTFSKQPLLVSIP